MSSPPMFLIFILFCLIQLSDSTMIVVYGTPETYSNPQYNNSYNEWKDCIQFCDKEPSCVLAYDNAGECEWFKYEDVTKVKQGSEVEGERVAFKVNNISTPLTCPSGINPPTFNNENAYGNLIVKEETNTMGVNYTISYDSGYWTFYYITRKACPSYYWLLSNRADNFQWCMSADIANVPFNYDITIETCKYSSFNFTGVKSQEELDYIIAQGVEYQFNETPNFTMRVDGKRTEACQNTPRSEECMSDKLGKFNPATGFTFLDPNGGTLKYYSWVTDAGARAGPDNDCLVLVFIVGQDPKADVQSCSDVTDPPMRSWLCGVEAWNYKGYW